MTPADPTVSCSLPVPTLNNFLPWSPQLCVLGESIKSHATSLHCSLGTSVHTAADRDRALLPSVTSLHTTSGCKASSPSLLLPSESELRNRKMVSRIRSSIKEKFNVTLPTFSRYHLLWSVFFTLKITAASWRSRASLSNMERAQSSCQLVAQHACAQFTLNQVN